MEKSEGQKFLVCLHEIIEANFQNTQFGVNELARSLGMDRSTLHRKVKKYKGISVSQFICMVKLKYAMALLKDTSKTVSEVAFASGFHSITYFSKCFRDNFGFSPGETKYIMRLQMPDKKNKNKKWMGFLFTF